MAENITLARPYARAAFEVARDSRQLDQWMSMLATAAQIADTPKVQALLSSPSIAAETKGSVMVELLGGGAGSPAGGAGSPLNNLFDVLARNDRLELLPEIARLFHVMKTQYEKQIEVEVISAYPVSAELQSKLIVALKRKLERDVKVTTSVDESLLGGAVIRAGDTVIDGSVRGRLSKLADALHA